MIRHLVYYINLGGHQILRNSFGGLGLISQTFAGFLKQGCGSASCQQPLATKRSSLWLRQCEGSHTKLSVNRLFVAAISVSVAFVLSQYFLLDNAREYCLERRFMFPLMLQSLFTFITCACNASISSHFLRSCSKSPNHHLLIYLRLTPSLWC